MFVFKKESIRTVALIYVDGILLIDNNIDKINKVKTHLQNRFSIKDLGPLKYLLEQVGFAVKI